MPPTPVAEHDMIAVDTNLLVYALRQDSEFHADALKSLLSLAESGRRWGIPWPCLHEYLSIATHSRIYAPPTPMPVAVKALDVWLNSPNCELLAEGPGYWPLLKSLLTQSKCTGSMVHDARIVALCLHHGVRELWSADRDFSRFSKLRTKNPLVA